MKRRMGGAAVLAAAAMLTGCKPPPLPAAQSPAAQLYVSRCGQCHAPYNPRALTPAMWEWQLTLMEARIHQAGLPPLSADDRKAILDYLSRNSNAH